MAKDWSYISGASDKALRIALAAGLIGFRRGSALVESRDALAQENLEISDKGNFLIVKGQSITGNPPFNSYKVDGETPLRDPEIRRAYAEHRAAHQT